MGLELYLGEYESNPPDEVNDPEGHRSFFFEVLRELSDVTEVKETGVNGDPRVRVKISEDEFSRVFKLVKECVPPNRMNGFVGAIDQYSSDARLKLRQIELMNGHANLVEKHVIAVSLRLSEAVRHLLIASATGDDPVAPNEDFNAERDVAIQHIAEEIDEEELDDWHTVNPQDEIVGEEEGTEEPWKESAHENVSWVPPSEDDDEESDDNWNGKVVHLNTPDPMDIDPETEAVILAEAAETIVDMRMEIDAFKRILEYKASRPKDEFVDDDGDAYAKTMIAIMEKISERNDGKINLVCLAIELRSSEIVAMMNELDDLQKIGCVSAIFHNVADTALMLVHAFSNMIDENDGDDEEVEEANGILILAYIQYLKERFDIA